DAAEDDRIRRVLMARGRRQEQQAGVEAGDEKQEAVHHAAELPQQRQARPSITASSTAMRTATPLLTWLRITDCGPSATSDAISMPRFMGCGCMTMASGLAFASRSDDRPNLAK